MDFWSRGLGDSSINLRFEEGVVENYGDSMEITGKMGEPVFWDYRTTVTEADIFDILHIMKHPDIVEFLGGTEKRWSLLFALIRGAVKFILLCGLDLLKSMVPWRKRPVSFKT